MSYVIRYLHFISILLVYAAVFVEFIMLSRTLKRKKLSFLAKIDGVYGIASIFVVGAGMAMWFGFDVGLGFKPTAWYMENPIFHLKYGLFVVVGILSIWPSIFFMRQRNGNQEDEIQIPNHIRAIIRIELIVLSLIPIFAILAAAGISV
ncbi:MAG TPA: DUF2214 domain-containing protein [Bacteroidetes bacterium]|nr:DUF2214 domain-containing protein [Bacteroidota bacterium]|tara:strand:- start:847 stop:1293 length:447 start_codon:yes stop_codon:yes gene_type:complete